MDASNLTISALSSDEIDFTIDTPRNFRNVTAKFYTEQQLFKEISQHRASEDRSLITCWKWEKVYFNETVLRQISHYLASDGCPIATVIVKSCYFSEKYWNQFLKGVIDSKSITSLDIRENLLSDECCQILSTRIEKNNQLQELLFTHLKMSVAGFDRVIDGICNAEKPLKNLSIDFYYLSSRFKESVFKLIEKSALEFIKWENTPTRGLALKTVRYTSSALEEDIAKSAREWKLEGKHFDREIMAKISNYLQQKRCPVSSLSLVGCYYTTEALKIFLKGVVKGNKITALQIKNSVLNNDDCLVLRLALINNRAIKTLALANININKDGFSDLVLGVCHRGQPLEELILDSCRLNASFGDSLKKLVKRCSLIKLSLHDNQLGTNTLSLKSPRGALGLQPTSDLTDKMIKQRDWHAPILLSLTAPKAPHHDCLSGEKHSRQRPIVALVEAMGFNKTLNSVILSSNRLSCSDYAELRKVSAVNKLVDINVTNNGLEEYPNRSKLKTSAASPRTESVKPSKSSPTRRRQSFHVTSGKAHNTKSQPTLRSTEEKVDSVDEGEECKSI